MRRRIGVMKIGWSSRAKCVMVVWAYGENGGGWVIENRISFERCEVEES